MTREELLQGLSEEQIAKVRGCHNPEELLLLAKKEGIELTEEQLSAISGGGCSDDKDDNSENKDTGHPLTNPF